MDGQQVMDFFAKQQVYKWTWNQTIMDRNKFFWEA